MRDMTKIGLVMLLFMCFSTGCVRAISKELRARVDPSVTVDYAVNHPESAINKTVMWGGVIAGTRNLKEGTLLEVVQKPIFREGRPLDTDRSEGRFLALYQGYLDVAIYAEGREVTVAGRLKGMEQRQLGEIEYTYPLMKAEEVYLWPKRVEREHYYYPYWYGPWRYWYSPRHPVGPWYW